MEDGQNDLGGRGAGANMYAANVISRQPTLIPAEADGGGVEFWSTIWREHERNCRGGGMLHAGHSLPAEEDAPKQEAARKSATRADNKNLH